MMGLVSFWQPSTLVLLLTVYTAVLFQTAYLLQECVMVRDGLAKLPDCFTVGDMCDIASYVSSC